MKQFGPPNWSYSRLAVILATGDVTVQAQTERSRAS